MRFAPLALMLLGGCALPGRMMTASTLGQGAIEGGFEVDVIAAAGGGGVGAAPNLAGYVRYGVSDNVDLGARLGFSGLELQSRFRVAGENGDGLVVSIAPSLVGIYLGGTVSNGDGTNSSGGVGTFSLPIPVLIGFQNGKGSEFILAPAITPSVVFGGGGGSSATVLVMSAGVGVSYSARVADRLRIQPELAFSMPFLGAASASDGTSTGSSVGVGTGGVLIQLGVGFTFGRRAWDI